jgi:hypothetical protein
VKIIFQVFILKYKIMAKFKIELNDSQNVRDVLQQAYDLSDAQIIQAQNEINKMATATKLQDEVMESKAKYGKIVNDYLSIIDKAISKKMEIAKLLTEILHHNGNVGAALSDTQIVGKQSFDLSKIKEMVKTMHDEKEQTKTIELNKK